LDSAAPRRHGESPPPHRAKSEKGDGTNLEALGALSNAFDVSIDVLQTDVEALMEQVRKEWLEPVSAFTPLTLAPHGTMAAHALCCLVADGRRTFAHNLLC
jgi:hypothetical protein